MRVRSDKRMQVGISERILIGGSIVFVLFFELLMCKPRVLMSGPFWLDECITAQIVEDPSISHAMQAVRHGVDTNPPVFHLIDRLVWRVENMVGIQSPRVGLRLVSMISAATTLLLLFVLLRRTFSVAASLAGVAAVWAHPDVVEQATDARFYPLLLLGAVAVILIGTDSNRGWFKQLLLALAAALLCTLHYFGIVSLGCIAGAIVFTDERSWKSRLIAIMPMMAGPVALLPFLWWIRDQSAGLSVKTWLDPFSFYTTKAFLGQVLCPLALFVVAAAWVINQLMRRAKHAGELDRQMALPLFSLAFVPLIIVIFSATVQSALRSRYAIPATLALAPLAAMIASRIDKRMIIAMIFVLGGVSVLELHGNANRRGALAARLSVERRMLAGGSNVLFAARSDAVELQQFAPDLAEQIAVLDVTGSGAVVRDFRRYENDMLRKTAEWYPTPPLVFSENLAALPLGSHDLLVSPTEDLPAILEHHALVHIADDIYRLSESASSVH